MLADPSELLLMPPERPELVPPRNALRNALRDLSNKSWSSCEGWMLGFRGEHASTAWGSFASPAVEAVFQHNSLWCGQPSVFAFVKGLAMITSEKNREDVEAVIRFPPFDKIAIFEAYRAFLNKREMRLPGFYAK